MEFIRPEVVGTLNRWRESLIGIAMTGFGAYWMMTETGARLIIGLALAAFGALLIIAGLQRARFRRGNLGPGVVQIDEGQLTYFGPFDGGILSVQDLIRLELDPTTAPGPSWVLGHSAGAPLQIPIDAAGADALFDVFANLPGLETEAMLARLQTTPDERVVIWERDRISAH